MQAGPLIKTKIPKDLDGKQKSFGFAVYKHEVSVPYAMQLLDGTSLYGRSLHVQFRSGEWWENVKVKIFHLQIRKLSKGIKGVARHFQCIEDCCQWFTN